MPFRTRAGLWAAVPVLALLALFFVAREHYRQLQLERTRTAAEDVLDFQVRSIEASAGRVYGLLEALSAFVAIETEGGGHSLDPARFRAFASSLHGRSGVVQAMQVVEDGVIRFVYPFKGNERTVGYDLLADPRPFIAGDVRRALESRGVTITGPVELIQGGWGIIVRKAVRPVPSAPERLVAVVVDLAELLHEAGAGLDEVTRAVRVAVRTRAGEVFFGDSSVFASDPVSLDIHLPDGVWQIGLVPAAGWAEGIRAPMMVFDASGATVLVLCALLAWFIAGRQAGLQHAVDRRTAELQENLALLKAVFEGTTDLIFVKDLECRYRMVNPTITRFFGKPEDEILGRDDSELFPPPVAARIMERDRQVMDSGEPGSFEDVLETGGGRHTFFTTKAPWRDSEGNIIGLVGIARDTTKRREMEEERIRLLAETEKARVTLLATLEEERKLQAALSESEARFRSLFEQSSEGIFLLDRDGLLVDVNQRLLKLFGYAKEEILERPLAALRPDVDAARDREALAAVLRDGTIEYEATFVRKDGTTFPAEVSCAVVRVGEKQLVQGLVLDITERRKAERQLRNLSSRLIRAQDEERRRVARELHDATSQNLAILNMNLARLEETLGPESFGSARLLVECQSMADRCVQDIRTVTYLLHPPFLDELGLLRAIRNFCGGLASRSGLGIELDVPEELPRFHPDVELAVFRVAQESLINVYRHSGSRVAWLHLRYSQNQLFLEVRDEGRGISGQVVTAGETTAGIAGVGLAGMRERVRALGGTFEAGNLNPGFVVRIQVPVREPDFHGE